jgi:hypothetical protein
MTSAARGSDAPGRYVTTPAGTSSVAAPLSSSTSAVRGSRAKKLLASASRIRGSSMRKAYPLSEPSPRVIGPELIGGNRRQSESIYDLAHASRRDEARANRRATAARPGRAHVFESRLTERQQRIATIRGVFPEVFGYKWAPFTSNPLGVSGLSDDAAGVQWNAWIDHATLGAFVGVNLEGKEYDDWPIARVIARELATPQLFSERDRLADSKGINVYIGREVWQASGRIKVPECVIDSMPVALSALTPRQWRESLLEADAALDDEAGRRKHAKMTVTLKSGKRVERDVSPQMQIYIEIPWSSYQPHLRTAMKDARARLEPLHKFLALRAATIH